MTGNRKSPPVAKPGGPAPEGDDSKSDGGLLSRWSARKTAVAHEEAEAVSAEASAKIEAAERQRTEARQIANRQAAEAIDIDIADYDTDFTPFLRDGVPAALRRRALKALWRTNPMLANVDGLNDYDEDFRVVEGAFEAIKSSWEVGRGYADKAEEVTREMAARDEEVRKAQAAEAEEGGNTDGDGENPDQDESEAKPMTDTGKPMGLTEKIDADGPPAKPTDTGDETNLTGTAPAEDIIAPARLSLRHRLLADEN